AEELLQPRRSLPQLRGRRGQRGLAVQEPSGAQEELGGLTLQGHLVAVVPDGDPLLSGDHLGSTPQKGEILRARGGRATCCLSLHAHSQSTRTSNDRRGTGLVSTW